MKTLTTLFCIAIFTLLAGCASVEQVRGEPKTTIAIAKPFNTTKTILEDKTRECLGNALTGPGESMTVDYSRASHTEVITAWVPNIGSVINIITIVKTGRGTSIAVQGLHRDKLIRRIKAWTGGDLSCHNLAYAF